MHVEAPLEPSDTEPDAPLELGAESATVPVQRNPPLELDAAAEGPTRFANGRLTLHRQIGRGGMASVHLGRLVDATGTRTVAVKRAHRRVAKQSDLLAMLMDEARVTLRLRHPNIVPTYEVILEPSELLLVMEYERGESIARLIADPRVKEIGMPAPIAAAIVVGAAEGLHAAHEATSEYGAPLGIVHRDVSPANIMVGVDGRARVLDFGIAKATERLQTTREGQLKGNLRYIAPERLVSTDLDRRVDIFGLATVFWECLTGRRLIDVNDDMGAVHQLLTRDFSREVADATSIPEALRTILRRGLSRSPEDRPPTAAAFASEVRSAIPIATEAEVADWLFHIAGDKLVEREQIVAAIEREAKPAETKPSTRRILLAVAALGATAAVVGVLLTRAAAPAPTTAADAGADEIELSPDPTPPELTASSAATSAPARTAPANRKRPSRTPRPTPKATCDPPYTVDARGIQRFKPGCAE